MGTNTKLILPWKLLSPRMLCTILKFNCFPKIKVAINLFECKSIKQFFAFVLITKHLNPIFNPNKRMSITTIHGLAQQKMFVAFIFLLLVFSANGEYCLSDETTARENIAGPFNKISGAFYIAISNFFLQKNFWMLFKLYISACLEQCPKIAADKYVFTCFLSNWNSFICLQRNPF